MKEAQSRTTMRSVLGWALLLPLIVLVTTGCFRIEMSFVVNDDGSGAVQYTVAISDLVTELMDAEDGSLVEEEDLPPGADFREYREDGYTGVVLTLPFTDYAEVRPFLAEGDMDFEPPEISQDESGDWRFSMLIPPFSEDEGTGGLDLSEDLLEDGWFRVRAKLPGDIAEHNADRVENGELVWEMGLDSIEESQLTARATSGGGPSVIAIGAAAAVAVIVVAVAVLFFTRRGSAGRVKS